MPGLPNNSKRVSFSHWRSWLIPALVDWYHESRTDCDWLTIIFSSCHHVEEIKAWLEERFNRRKRLTTSEEVTQVLLEGGAIHVSVEVNQLPMARRPPLAILSMTAFDQSPIRGNSWR